MVQLTMRKEQFFFLLCAFLQVTETKCCYIPIKNAHDIGHVLHQYKTNSPCQKVGARTPLNI